MRPLVPVLLLLVAGCVESGPARDVAGIVELPVDLADAFVLDHDHYELEAHEVAWNLRLHQWDGLAPKGTPSGAHAVDLHGNKLVVALHAESGETDRGFRLFDVSDPRLPRHIGTYVDERAEGGDRMVMFSGDGETVFLGAESSDAGEFLILAVDVADPTSPKLVAETPVPPYGPHTVFAAEVGGVQYVYVVSFGLQVFRYDASGFSLAGRYAAATPQQLLLNPDGLQQTRTYVLRDVYGHDVFAWEDPVAKRHVAFVAYAYDGFKIVDLTDPRVPRELSSWVPTDEGAPHYVHTVTVRMFGDRRIAAVGAESFEGRNRDVPSPVWFLDVTDLARPVHLATWTNPADVGSNDLLFSAHDMRFDEVGGRTYLWLAHYHGGVWVLDATDPSAPKEVAAYLPHEDQGFVPPGDCCLGLRMSAMPLTFDVIARGGVGYAADMWSGLYTLELEP